MKENIKIGTLIWTALLIRVLSQLIWEWADTYGLDMNEFVYGMILIPRVWFLSETAKLVTCMFAAFLALKLYFLVKQKFELTGIVAFIAYIIISSGIAYPHARIWTTVDCHIEAVDKSFSKNCVRENFSSWL